MVDDTAELVKNNVESANARSDSGIGCSKIGDVSSIVHVQKTLLSVATTFTTACNELRGAWPTSAAQACAAADKIAVAGAAGCTALATAGIRDHVVEKGFILSGSDVNFTESVGNVAVSTVVTAANEACLVLVDLLWHPAEQARLHACNAFSPILRLSLLSEQMPGLSTGPSSEPTSPPVMLSTAAVVRIRTVMMALLSQCGATSSALRAAALNAISSAPWLDSHAFNRAVKVPMIPLKENCSQDDVSGGATVSGGDASRNDSDFRDIKRWIGDDDIALAKSSADIASLRTVIDRMARWHGAIYFALDDDRPEVRIAALRALQGAAWRPELQNPEGNSMKGVFQRVAAVTFRCLADDDADVRAAAADALVDVTRNKKILLCLPGAPGQRDSGTIKSADVLSVNALLQVVRVHEDIAFKVFQSVRFETRRALEVALTGILIHGIDETDYISISLEEEKIVDSKILRLLADIGRINAKELTPAGGDCPERHPKGGRCKGLAHHLFHDLEVESPALVPSMLTASTAVGRRLRRLQSLVRGVLEAPRESYLAASRQTQPGISACVPTLLGFRDCEDSSDKVSSLRSISAKGIRDSLSVWSAFLGRCYDNLLRGLDTAAFAQSDGDCNSNAGCGVGVRLGLRRLRTECSYAVGQASFSSPALAGPIYAIIAWVDLLLAVAQALPLLEDGRNEAGCDHLAADDAVVAAAAAMASRASASSSDAKVSAAALAVPHEDVFLSSGARIYRATLRLIHGFEWAAWPPPESFPSVLLGFRFLGLRLLAAGGDIDADAALVAAGRRVGGVTVEEAERLRHRPLRAFLPRPAAGYFSRLLGADAAGILVREAAIVSVASALQAEPKMNGFAAVAVGGTAAGGTPASSAALPSKLPRSSLAALRKVVSSPLRMSAVVGSELSVEVLTNVQRGLWLVATLPCAGPGGAEFLQYRTQVPPATAAILSPSSAVGAVSGEGTAQVAADKADGVRSGMAQSALADFSVRCCRLQVHFPCVVEEPRQSLSLQLTLRAEVSGGTNVGCDGAAVAVAEAAAAAAAAAAETASATCASGCGPAVDAAVAVAAAADATAAAADVAAGVRGGDVRVGSAGKAWKRCQVVSRPWLLQNLDEVALTEPLEVPFVSLPVQTSPIARVCVADSTECTARHEPPKRPRRHH
eukprot:TRINITY_DN73739_c0_g1_i1.p1 TRINITY_DN73739_c0_g1~~TRINITY_DN73739_c0_g1_i1.p1  ORF type:complete len:1161 (+),score=185.84 TRINITY_DN73739_c0_g1_i1:172-3654(+)